MMQAANTQAELEWRDGLPYSTAFDDVYFSSDNGLLETEYVFIQGNQLAARWQSLAGKRFSIIETGFGTGLNFLCAGRTWLQFAPADAVLHFTSVEKHPLGVTDMHTALAHWHDLKPYADELFGQYQSLLDTGSASLFSNRIQLRVLLGDATSCLAKLDTKLNTKADAWFLDGFTPSKNPDMWQPALFAQMARLSHAGTSFATFTSAGIVRRGLAEAGFQVNKRAGFGRKREMITGHYAGRSHDV